jgi:hypothetical protein
MKWSDVSEFVVVAVPIVGIIALLGFLIVALQL